MLDEGMTSWILGFNDEELELFYRKLTVELGINRHSDVKYQLQKILAAEGELLWKIIQEVTDPKKEQEPQT